MHWEFPYVASLGLDGDCSLGVLWNGCLCNALGFHGLALGLLIGNSMEVLYGYAIGMYAWDSHGIALVMLHRSTMEVPYG